MLRDVVGAGAVELYEHVVDRVLQRALDVRADPGHGRREGAQRGRFVRWVAVDRVAVGRVNGRHGLEWVGGCRSLAIGIDLALYCHQARHFAACRLVQVLLGAWRAARWRTSVMHHVPCHFLHQVLECDVCELWRKDVLDQIGVALSDPVAYAQYWHDYLRTTNQGRRENAAGCISHIAYVMQ